jgi:endogenous inhibitor of DNA gyrase (YacG/DUF329 family)
MTKEQKSQITKLRTEGYGYNRVAQMTGLSENTVKSFCRRNNLTGMAIVDLPKIRKQVADGMYYCKCCGVYVEQKPGRKEKKFCSDKCRMEWWNNNLDKVKRKAVYEFTCPYCKKKFKVYGNSRRKYCSHECYVADRFGGGRDE